MSEYGQLAGAMFGVALGIVIWAVFVLWAQIRLRSERRLRRYAMRLAAELGLREGSYVVVVNRSRACTVLTWWDDESFHTERHIWRNRMDQR